MRLNVKQKLILLTILVLVPLVCMVVYILRAMLSYSDAYDRIVSNMTTANQYNLNFEEELDDSIYRLVVSGIAFDGESPTEDAENPYRLIASLESDFQQLQNITENDESRQRLRILLRNVSTLRERVDDIADNLREGGHYDDNIEMLNDNIYILTELIQDNIQTYLYYQTESIDLLKNTLNHNVLIFSRVMIGGLLLLCVLIMAVVSVLQRSITEPLAALGETTKRIAQGDFTVRSEVKSRMSWEACRPGSMRWRWPWRAWYSESVMMRPGCGMQSSGSCRSRSTRIFSTIRWIPLSGLSRATSRRRQRKCCCLFLIISAWC